ncbi:MAG: 2-oxoacid:acceptor oxidoreductase family protein [Syntrophales bacterium]|jgi:pyruvate ferredoxin oxidoreductase gamma subunit/2-oxoisovalerate ferredoxin oxidoreductase gamma subunit|nr:2-oxoacid:acceptor oxidoreductase family protein [Syntrophales bacterium]MDY0043202.1 2-oxoacid:acceptor oxidoreductase family protein [Syntrophales bacterium]
MKAAKVRNSKTGNSENSTKEKMRAIEVRLHGRGGRGIVAASVLLAKAFFRAGFMVQNSSFGEAEKKRAPVTACLHINQRGSDKAITGNNRNPDHILIQDRTLLQNADIAKGLNPGGWILINAPESCTETESFLGFTPAYIDASKIARAYDLGSSSHPEISAAMIGAFTALLGIPPFEKLMEAIEEEFADEADKNIQAAREAFRNVRRPILKS